MKYLYARNEHYKLFMEKHDSERLKKNLKVLPSTKFNKVFEVFDRIINTDYELYDNDVLVTCVFWTYSDNEYRLDLLREYEENYGNVNHISFTSNDVYGYEDPGYENLTNKGEMIEILNRIHFIIKDLVDKKVLNNQFCIGGAELESKNNIYQNFLRVVVGKDGFDKVDMGYNTGWGLIFKI